MANNPDPGGPIAVGIAAGNSPFPQWGVAGTVGNNSSWKISEAKNNTQKLALEKQGYLTWFTSQQAAKNFIGSQTSVLNGQVPNPLSWIAKVTGFSGTNFVLRATKVIIGGVLLISGIVHLTGIDKAALGAVGKGIIPV